MHRRTFLPSLSPSRPALGGLVLLTALVAGCSTPQHRAPVEERRGAPPRPAATVPPASGVSTAPAAQAEPVRPPLPGAENAGKPGYYSVRPGDTLIRIALDHGQPWRELVRWNALENPNQIEVGQVLRVVPPGADPNTAASRPVVSARVESRPLDAKPAVPAAGGAAAPAGAVAGPSSAPAVAGATAPSAAPSPAPKTTM